MTAFFYPPIRHKVRLQRGESLIFRLELSQMSTGHVQTVWKLTHGSGGLSGGPVREREQLCSAASVLRVCFVYSPFLYRSCSCSLCLLFS